ncbi:MAG: signal peptidase II [Ignavibacteria bacterium]|jgi:signal peptidase II|nr:signal peptidase II [Ignavibacteria bacterium]MDH7528497.1 signal peptidase II [Ignavibacteria bacterium]NPV11247.1 signal peptidase II [Ignavibacteria bacterium]
MKIFYVTFFIVLADQITKILIKGIKIPALGIDIKGMQLYDSFNVIGDFFRITYIENPGMAFGIDFGEKAKLFLTLFSLIASIVITFYLIKNKNEKLTLRLPLAMILGGAVGNLIDRMFYGLIYGDAPLFYGKVVDFLDFDFFNITLFGYTYDRWPIFNIADMSVTIGVILLIILHREPKEEKQSQAEQQSENQSEGAVTEKVFESDVIETLSSNDEVHRE